MEVEDRGPVIVFDEEIVAFVLDLVRISEIEVLVLEEMEPELLLVVDDRDRLVELELLVCFDNELPFEELDDEVLFNGEPVFDEVAFDNAVGFMEEMAFDEEVVLDEEVLFEELEAELVLNKFDEDGDAVLDNEVLLDELESKLVFSKLDVGDAELSLEVEVVNSVKLEDEEDFVFLADTALTKPEPKRIPNNHKTTINLVLRRDISKCMFNRGKT